jgi:hypothetical protein
MLRLSGGRDMGIVDEVNEAPFSAAELPTGWSVLWANDFLFVSEDRLAALSTNNEIVACQVYETVNFTAAYAYLNGAYQWSILHAGDEDVWNLDVAGALPSAFERVRKGLTDAQAADPDVDYISDVPLETAQAICGYRHDRASFDWGEPVFTIVELSGEN